MQDSTDMDLLRQYAGGNSDAAFAVLVSRHVNLVYSAALRKTGNPHAAEEITQAVFIILARKAGRIPSQTILPGWLYQTARLTASSFLRGEIRRVRREQEVYMQTEPHTVAPDETWEQLAPLLEDAMGQLADKDRAAVVLRFFGGKSFAEVATTAGVSENAAKKRVSHALEKLHRYFSKRGVSSTTAIIAGAISTHSVQAAPAALAKAVTAVAVVKGSTAAASTLTLVKGTMKTMTWLKLKIATGLGMSALLVGGVATVAISQTGSDDQLTPQEIAKQAQDAYAALSSYSDTETAISEGGGQTGTTTSNIRLQRPGFYRIDWKGTGGLYAATGEAWSDGGGDFFETGAAGQEKSVQAQKVNSMQQVFALTMGVSGSPASIPATFFKQNYGDALAVPALGRSHLKKEGDEQVGDVDCFVISSSIDPMQLPNNRGNTGITTTTFWIGKRDHLIHQTRTTVEGATFTLPPESDSNLRTILERQNKAATPEAIATLRAELEKSMKRAQGAKYVFTQTHENIVANKRFSRSNFGR